LARELRALSMAIYQNKTELPDYPDRILLEHWVRSNDRPAFFHTLRDENTVEGIAVMQLQSLNLQYMFEFNGKHAHAIRTHFRSQIIARGNWQRELPGAYFDQNLPNACHTQEPFGRYNHVARRE